MSSVYAGNEGHWENVPELHRRVAAEIIDGAQNVRPAKLPDAPLSTDPGREDWIEGSSLWGICAACACKDVAFRIAGKFNSRHIRFKTDAAVIMEPLGATGFELRTGESDRTGLKEKVFQQTAGAWPFRLI